MTDAKPDRLRTPPRERFTGDTKLFDLERVFERLEDEAHGGVQGHRQITLLKDGTSTVVAFLFEKDGRLPDHKADGLAIIQILEGRVDIETPDEHHQLGAGGLLVLKPNISHDVRAAESTKMILTLSLRQRSSKSAPTSTKGHAD